MNRREVGAVLGCVIVALASSVIVVSWGRTPPPHKPVAEPPVSPYQQRLVSYHEAGHAVVATYIPWGREVTSVTTIQEGENGGICSYVDVPSLQITKARLLADIIVSYGGFC